MSAARSGLVICLLLMFAAPSQSQEETPASYKYPDAVSYSKAKIYLSGNERLEVVDLTIEKDHLSYKVKGSATTDGRDLQDIQVIKVSEGTRAGESALYGGLGFGLSALLAIVQVESTPNTELTINKPLLVGGFAAAGILLGGIAGSTQDKWKTLYVRERADLRIHQQIFVSFDPRGRSLYVNFGF